MKASSTAAVGGIAAVGDIAAVGEWARNFVLGLRAPLSQSFVVAYYLSPLVYRTSHWCFFFAAGIAAVGGITAVVEWARN